MHRPPEIENSSEDPKGFSFIARRPCGPLNTGTPQLTGYSEHTGGVCVRREEPIPAIVVVLDLGPGIEVNSSGPETGYENFDEGFVAGLTLRSALVRHAGHQRGVQLNLRPTFAHRLFRLPLSEIVGRSVPIGEVIPDLSELRERAALMPDWPGRLRLTEEWLGARLLEPSSASDVVDWSLQQILDARGDVDVARLARRSGYSSRHLGRMFRAHVGLPPKRFARLVQFHHLTQRVKALQPTPWSELATDTGYADQAHLSRTVQEIVGLAPEEWRLTLQPPMQDSSIP